MNKAIKDLRKAYLVAILISMFYGGLFAVSVGGWFFTVIPLVMFIFTLEFDHVFEIMFIGGRIILAGLIVASVCCFSCYMGHVDPKGPPKPLENVMTIVVCITTFITYIITLLTPILIDYAKLLEIF